MLNLSNAGTDEKKLIKAANTGELNEFISSIKVFLLTHPATLHSVNGGFETLYHRFFRAGQFGINSEDSFRQLITGIRDSLVTENRLVLYRAVIDAAVVVGCLGIIDELLLDEEVNQDQQLLVAALESALSYYRPRVCHSLIKYLNVLALDPPLQAAMRYFNKILAESTAESFAKNKPFRFYGVSTIKRSCDSIYNSAKEASRPDTNFYLEGHQLTVEEIKKLEPANPDRENHLRDLLETHLKFDHGELMLEYLLRNLRYGGVLCPATALIQDIFSESWEEAPQFDKYCFIQISRKGDGVLLEQRVGINTFKMRRADGILLYSPCKAQAVATVLLTINEMNVGTCEVYSFDIQDQRYDLGFTSKVFEKLVKKTKRRIAAGLV
jgi:hypothetical protein